MVADDAELVRRSRLGDRAAFGDLVRRYQDRLYHVVYRLVGHADDSRDVVQDALINAFKALDQFQGDAQFFTWLYRIAVNAAVSHQRKRRTDAARPLCAGRASREPADESYDHMPGAALERAEDSEVIQQALLWLSSEFRSVVVLRDIDGLSYESIGDILEIPLGTVRSRIHRGRLELRQLLCKRFEPVRQSQPAQS